MAKKQKQKQKQKIEQTQTNSETDWRSVLLDFQMLILAMLFINAANAFQDDFSWFGLGVFLSGLAFVFMILYLKNTRFEK